MELVRQLLEERYFKNLKTNQDLYVGIELEFPIVNLKGKAVRFEVVFGLFDVILDQLPFAIEKTDSTGQAIQLVSEENEDRILFEVGYNTLEFAFDKAKTIGEVDNRFAIYLEVIQTYLRAHGHLLTGLGVNPFWDINDNRPVASPRYEMLMAYLNLGKQKEDVTINRHDFGAFIQGSQVQLDVTPENLIRTLNAFNALEPVKAWLFANSYLWHGQLDTLVSRDVFWEGSMHGIFPENTGVFPQPFADKATFLDYLTQTALFTRSTSQADYYFAPIQVADYFNHDEIVAYDLAGQDAILSPSPYDFKDHRSYQYQSLTARGTVEFRSCCAQPLADTFTVAAFHLGLMCQLPELEQLIAQHDFFEDYGRNYPDLRRRFSAKALSEELLVDIISLTENVLELATEGLKQRGFGEEVYLTGLYDRLSRQENPAQRGLRLLATGYSLSDISEQFANGKDI